MRGRKAAQIAGIQQYDFDKLAKTEGNARERRRVMAFAHIREGKTFTETVLAIRVKLRTLMNWVKQFKNEGVEGLKDKEGRGAKPFLPEEHHLAFRQAVLELQKIRDKVAEVLPVEIAMESVDIWFQDEARVGQRGTVTRTWAVKGTRPKLTRQQQFEYAYIFGAVCPARDEAVGIVMHFLISILP